VSEEYELRTKLTVEVMGALKSKASDDDAPHEVRTVLPHHMGGGPQGLGMSVALSYCG